VHDPVVVTVENGVVQSRVRSNTGAAVKGYEESQFPAVEGYFDVIEREIHAGATVSVHYDPATGVPFDISASRSDVMDYGYGIKLELRVK